MKRLAIVLATLLGSAAIWAPTAAAQPAVQPVAQPTTQQVQCAVGYVGGPQHVVLTVGTYDTSALVGVAGSLCTQLIAMGTWTGVNNQSDWVAGGYQLLCTIPFGPTASADVYAQPYVADRTIGYQMCDDGGDAVVFTNAGPALDVPHP